MKTYASFRSRPGGTRPVVRCALACAVVAAAALLQGCGGGSDEPSGGQAITEGSASVTRLLSCDASGENCTEVPEDCEERPQCLLEQCPESGGCVPAFLKRGPFVFGTQDEFRLCFDLVLARAAPAEPVGESSPASTGETETGENDTDEEDGGISSVRCEGPSYVLKGLDLSKIEGELEPTADGQLVWLEAEPSLLVSFADGAFTVRNQP